MNLPPFPFLPSTPEERIRWVQWGEQIRAMAMDELVSVANEARQRGSGREWRDAFDFLVSFVQIVKDRK